MACIKRVDFNLNLEGNTIDCVALYNDSRISHEEVIEFIENEFDGGNCHIDIITMYAYQFDSVFTPADDRKDVEQEAAE